MNNKTLRQSLQNCAKPIQKLEAQDSWCKHFYLPANFIGFQGHFPNKPVLPAVVQVLMAQVAVNEITGQDIQIKEILQAKFTAPIGSESHIDCIITKKQNDSWHCSIKANDVLSAKFSWQGVNI